MTGSGKWSQLGVPHKGWTCTGIEDLDEPNAVCEMCEVQEIRYVHYMQHPDYPHALGVGCVCAEHMEDDYEGPRRREQALKNAASRRKRWLSRAWRVSAKGNDYLNADGFTVTIFPQENQWGGVLINRQTDEKYFSERQYPTKDAAKLAAFDALIFLKDRKRISMTQA
jgi:hypothetical protein